MGFEIVHKRTFQEQLSTLQPNHVSQITRKLAVLYDNPHFAGLALRPHEVEADQVQVIPAQRPNSLVAVNG